MRRLGSGGLYGLALAAAALIASVSCDERVAPVEGDVTCEIRWTQSALTGGTSSDSYLGLETSQANAIVHLEMAIDTPPYWTSCSGVLVGPSRVLTAAHCTQSALVESVSVSFGDDFKEPQHVVRGVVGRVHPDLDLLEVRLDEPAAQGGYDVIPISTAPAMSELGFRDGALAQLAGHGMSEQASGPTRAFAVEEIVEVTDDEIVVSGQRFSGACVGDSGGPLLGRGRGGSVVVLGVLAEGASSCFGEDRYVRIDQVQGWLSEGADTEEVSAPECRQLSVEGRCYGQVAVWCDGTEYFSEACEEHATCGWDIEQGGYRCVQKAVDPCEGAGDLGTCEEDGAIARRCDRGELVISHCELCGGHCARSPRSGRVVCVEVPAADAGSSGEGLTESKE